MIFFTVTANLLLKSGVAESGVSSSGISGLLNWRVLAGLLSFGAGVVFYILILTKLPLNVAQSFASIQFVAVILASWLILGEPIGSMRWIGITLISLGIVLVGITVS
jgi:drug/metabolite transporter (DMT)-like permease